MIIPINMIYTGQKPLSGMSANKTGQYEKWNALAVYLLCEDGETITARMGLPKGEIAAVAPITQPMTLCTVHVSGFAVEKGVTSLRIASCTPIGKAGAARPGSHD